jgi:hypothetical protein
MIASINETSGVPQRALSAVYKDGGRNLKEGQLSSHARRNLFQNRHRLVPSKVSSALSMMLVILLNGLCVGMDRVLRLEDGEFTNMVEMVTAPVCGMA